jgi:hypothetical protein
MWIIFPYLFLVLTPSEFLNYNKINYQDTILLMALYAQAYPGVKILIKFTSKLILTLLFIHIYSWHLEECFTKDRINIIDNGVNMTQNREKVSI